MSPITKSMASIWAIIPSNVDFLGDRRRTKIWRILTRIAIAAKFLNFFFTTSVAFLKISPTRNGWLILLNYSLHARSWVVNLMNIIFHSQVTHKKRSLVAWISTHTKRAWCWESLQYPQRPSTEIFTDDRQKGNYVQTQLMGWSPWLLWVEGRDALKLISRYWNLL